MKGHSTTDCFLKCLSNASVAWRDFSDLRGVSDRASKDVMEELIINVLMDKIVHNPFPKKTEVTIYADDILLQSESPRTLTSALHQLEVLCVQMGFVINTSRTKFQTSLKVC